MPWHVYLARCADGSLYTGVATDVAARIATHNAGRGAKYTRARRPVALAWSARAGHRAEALRLEWRIKQLARADKDRLTRGDTMALTEWRGLPRAGLDFLRGLRRNNRKEWFEARRDTYEAALRGPLRALAEAMDVRLARFAPEIVGDPRRSLFRIHRDVRFSNDKSPYKTNAGLWFYHRDAGRGVGQESGGGAGFYLHVEPGNCFVAGGLWMPPKPALDRIRGRLDEAPHDLARIVRTPAFRRAFGALDEEAMLTRTPRGFAPDHPAATWLRYKSFTASAELPESALLRADLPRVLERRFVALLPLVRWLNGTMGFGAAGRR
jgi:uncharacterized protein (TIGR02453 family)